MTKNWFENNFTINVIIERLLRIFCGFPSGAIKMKGMTFIGKTLSELIKNEDLFVDVREEVTIILETLKPLDKPNPVRVEGMIILILLLYLFFS
jgi:hypothetical protein